MGSLVADRGVGAMAWQDNGVRGKNEEPIVDRVDDGAEIAAGEFGGSRPTWEQRVPGEQQRRSLDMERNGSGGVAWIVN